MRNKFRARGTSLVELLVATVFLGLTASAMLTAIAAAQSQTDIARWRSIALGLAQDKISTAKSDATNGNLATGTTTTNPAGTGLPSTPTVTVDVASVSGFTDLYSVRVTVTFTRTRRSNTTTETVKLATMVRQPDA